MMRSRNMNEVIGGKQYLAGMAILMALLATLFFSACAHRTSSEEQQFKLQSPAIQMNAGKPQMMMQIGGQYPSPRHNPFPYYPFAASFSQPLGDD